MADEIKGIVRPSNRRPKQERLTSNTYKLGIYHDDNGKAHSSTITLWVPKPTDVNHEPGIMLSLHNGAGRAFTRIQPEELQQLIQFLSDQVEDLTDKLKVATFISDNLRQTDKLTHELLKQIEPEKHPEFQQS